MLNIFSLAYQAEPFIERHLSIFEQLKVPWHWFVVFGPANNGGSTRWCQPQEPGLGTDGTCEYLSQIVAQDGFLPSRRITVLQKDLWPSKDAMVQAALNEMHEPGVLMQIDSDELWLAGQLEKIVELFESDPSLGAMAFFCRYFVGPDLICVGEDCWSNGRYDWIRAWRFEPGMEVVSHEPPKFDRMLGRMMEREETREHGLVFDHFAWATEKQVAYKAEFYGGQYANAVEGWRELQSYAAIKNFPEPFSQFPVPLRRYFNWVDDKVMVTKK